MAKKKGKILAYLVLLALIVFGIYTWYQKTYVPVLPLELQNNNTNVPEVTPTETEEVVIQNSHTDEESTYFSIHATYPKNGPAAKTIGDYVEKTIATFKKENDPTSLSEIEKENFGLNDGRKYILTITYDIKSSAVVETYVIQIYTDTGGAHGFQDIQTFSYDTTGKALTLDSFFTKSGYLPVLGTLAGDMLAKQLGDYAQADMISAGTAPVIANFSDFYTTDSSIIFLFPPYAVAPYAAGLITLSIPVASFGAIIERSFFPEY